jgi:zinc protease
MRIENNPEAMLSEQMEAALFRNHPYGRPVIGWMHEMEGLTKQDVLDFHNKWYTPSNAILIISGDITAKEVKPLAEKYYGGLPKTPAAKRAWNEEPPQNVQRHLVMHHANVKQPEWVRTYAVSSVAYGKKEQALPLFILGEILGDGKTSRLYQALVVEQKLASGVSVGYNGFTIGPASFDISITPENGVALEALEKAVDKELADALSKPVTENEIKRAKTLLKAETIFARDSLTSMSRIMGTIRMSGLDADYFNRWPDMIEAVTANQITDAAKDALQIIASVTAYLLPQGEP